MTDFHIIGAGINGLLTARELLQEGAKVALYDRQGVGAEASWAGGGIVSPLYPWRYGEKVTALATWAQNFYPSLVESLISETGIDPEYQRNGLLMFDAADAGSALAWADKNHKSILVPNLSNVYDSESNLNQRFTSVLHMPDVASVRNPRLCQALALSLDNAKNCSLSRNTELIGLKWCGTRISELVFSQNGSKMTAAVDSGHVVFCSGAWTNKLLAHASLKSDIKPIKGQMLLYKMSRPPIQSIVLSEGRYVIPRQDGHLLVGSTLEDRGFDKTTTEEALLTLRNSAEKLLPLLKDCRPIKQWAGLRPGSPDGVPLIGKVSKCENLSVNAGQFRNGLVLAPASVRVLVDGLMNRPCVIKTDDYAADSSRILSTV